MAKRKKVWITGVISPRNKWSYFTLSDISGGRTQADPGKPSCRQTCVGTVDFRGSWWGRCERWMLTTRVDWNLPYTIIFWIWHVGVVVHSLNFKFRLLDFQGCFNSSQLPTLKISELIITPITTAPFPSQVQIGARSKLQVVSYVEIPEEKKPSNPKGPTNPWN